VEIIFLAGSTPVYVTAGGLGSTDPHKVGTIGAIPIPAIEQNMGLSSMPITHN